MAAELARTYGIQSLVKGPITKAGNVPDSSLFSWPNLLMMELVVFLVTVAGILLVSVFFNAPLEEPVNIMHPPNPAKAPWYFLGLQEMVSYSAFWGGVGIPDCRGCCCCCCCRMWTASRAGWANGLRASACWPTTLFITFAMLNID